MKARLLFLILTVWLSSAPSPLHAEVTIEGCVEKALANYPEIKKFELISLTRDIELSDIDKSWLPRISVYGLLTAQNVIPEFPDALSGMLEQHGTCIRGLGKLQYKAGADINQKIWDGGTSRARKNVSLARAEVSDAATAVELYAVRQRVENLFFSILLTEEQITQSEETQRLLRASIDRLRSMLANGTAIEADIDMMEAHYLTIGQTVTQARAAAGGYRRVLGMFTGDDIGDAPLAKPSAEMPVVTTAARPELILYDKRLAANAAVGSLADKSVMPVIGAFAQAYYGYPGLNYFKSMIDRDLTFNIMAGIKVSWQIDSFYTRRNLRRRTANEASDIAAEREIFLFNNRVAAETQIASINGLQVIAGDDAKIVTLRTNVRKTAESQLENGIVDTTALLAKITDENMARLTAKYHEIKLLQEIYNLKYILNR